MPLGNSRDESRRDSGSEPRVARHELPWEPRPQVNNPKGVAARRRKGDTTPLGLEPLRAGTQGSSLARNPGLEDAIPLGLQKCAFPAIRSNFSSVRNSRNALDFGAMNRPSPACADVAASARRRPCLGPPSPRLAAYRTVAQIFNLPYRRFVIGRTLLAADRWQVKNLRYSAARPSRNATLPLLHLMEERAGERRRPPLSSVLSPLLRRGARKKNLRSSESSRPATISRDTDRLQVCATGAASTLNTYLSGRGQGEGRVQSGSRSQCALRKRRGFA